MRGARRGERACPGLAGWDGRPPPLPVAYVARATCVTSVMCATHGECPVWVTYVRLVM